MRKIEKGLVVLGKVGRVDLKEKGGCVCVVA